MIPIRLVDDNRRVTEINNSVLIKTYKVNFGFNQFIQLLEDINKRNLSGETNFPIADTKKMSDRMKQPAIVNKWVFFML